MELPAHRERGALVKGRSLPKQHAMEFFKANVRWHPILHGMNPSPLSSRRGSPMSVVLAAGCTSLTFVFPSISIRVSAANGWRGCYRYIAWQAESWFQGDTEKGKGNRLLG